MDVGSNKSRKDTRAVVSLVARYRSPSTFEYVEEACTDVSLGGMFIQSLDPAPAGTLLKLECETDSSGEQIRGVARVVWLRRDPNEYGSAGMGVKFVKLEPGSKETITRVVQELAAAGVRAASISTPPEARKTTSQRYHASSSQPTANGVPTPTPSAVPSKAVDLEPYRETEPPPESQSKPPDEASGGSKRKKRVVSSSTNPRRSRPNAMWVVFGLGLVLLIAALGTAIGRRGDDSPAEAEAASPNDEAAGDQEAARAESPSEVAVAAPTGEAQEQDAPQGAEPNEGRQAEPGIAEAAPEPPPAEATPAPSSATNAPLAAVKPAEDAPRPAHAETPLPPSAAEGADPTRAIPAHDTASPPPAAAMDPAVQAVQPPPASDAPAFMLGAPETPATPATPSPAPAPAEPEKKEEPAPSPSAPASPTSAPATQPTSNRTGVATADLPYIITFVTRPVAATVTIDEQKITAPGDIDLGRMPARIKVSAQKEGFASTSIWLDRTEFTRSGDALRRKVYLTLPPLSAATNAPKPK
jgi:hypothetical protein